MNDFINAHNMERKERIAFDLMLKIAHCNSHCAQAPKPDSVDVSESNHAENPCTEVRDKAYWLELYSECLAVVEQKKIKK